MDSAEFRKREIYRVTFVGFVANLLLTAAKFAAGILGRSGAMVADAVHSLSDMATDIVVIVFAGISAKPRDDGHDYGHGKYETLASILISLALVAVGVGILLQSIRSIRMVVAGSRLDSGQGAALPLYGAGRTPAREPQRGGQRLAPPQRRLLVDGHARGHRLRLLPG